MGLKNVIEFLESLSSLFTLLSDVLLGPSFLLDKI